jgi:hypothetical protein
VLRAVPRQAPGINATYPIADIGMAAFSIFCNCPGGAISSNSKFRPDQRGAAFLRPDRSFEVV